MSSNTWTSRTERNGECHSHENSENDKDYRALQESLVEAERVLIAISSAMEIDKK